MNYLKENGKNITILVLLTATVLAAPGYSEYLQNKGTAETETGNLVFQYRLNNAELVERVMNKIQLEGTGEEVELSLDTAIFVLEKSDYPFQAELGNALRQIKIACKLKEYFTEKEKENADDFTQVPISGYYQRMDGNLVTIMEFLDTFIISSKVKNVKELDAYYEEITPMIMDEIEKIQNTCEYLIDKADEGE